MGEKYAAMIRSEWQDGADNAHISSFVIVRKGRGVLLEKWARSEWVAGKWTLPSDMLLFGESPEDAAKRAVKEQLGVVTSSPSLLQVQSHSEPGHWDLCFVYEAKLRGKPKPTADVAEVQYFDPRRLPEEVDEGNRDIIEAFLKR